MINKLIEDLKLIPEIEAIAIGGSRATNNFDPKSDYDVYLYCTGSIDESIRRNILSKYCKYMEIGNHFWELEDNCTLNDDIDIDILYRNIDDFNNTLNYVVNECNPYNGYTTCMWHNLMFYQNHLYFYIKYQYLYHHLMYNYLLIPKNGYLFQYIYNI